MNEQNVHGMPNLPVGFNDLVVLRNIIRGYLAYMRRTALPAREKQRQMRLLEGVYKRLVEMPTHALEVVIPLTAAEIDALNSAVLGFAAFVRQKVSPSRERDETLQTLEDLRWELVGMLASQG